MEFLHLLYLNKKIKNIKTFILVFIMETTSFIYCVKCKKKAMTANIETVKTINNRMRIKGNCVICQCKKSQFMKLPVSKKTGSGIGDILNYTIGKLGDLGI